MNQLDPRNFVATHSKAEETPAEDYNPETDYSFGMKEVLVFIAGLSITTLLLVIAVEVFL